MGSIKRGLSAIDRYFLLNHPSLWMVRSHQVIGVVLGMAALAFGAALATPIHADAVPDVDTHFLVLLAATVAGALYWARSVWRRSRSIPLFRARRRGVLMALCFAHGALLFAPTLLFCRRLDARIASAVGTGELRSDVRAMATVDSAFINYRLGDFVRDILLEGERAIAAEVGHAWRSQLAETQALREELQTLEASDAELRNDGAKYARIYELRMNIKERNRRYALELERRAMPSADEFRALEEKYCGATATASARDHLGAASLDVLSHLAPLVTIERPSPRGSEGTSAKVEYRTFVFPSMRPAFVHECVEVVGNNVNRIVRAKGPPLIDAWYVSLHAHSMVRPAIALGAFYVALIFYLLLYLGPKAVIGSLVWVTAFFGAMVLSYAFGGATALIRARYGVDLPYPVLTPAALALYGPAALLGFSLGWAQKLMFRAALGLATLLVSVPIVPFFAMWEEHGRKVLQGDVSEQLSWLNVSIAIALTSRAILALHQWLVKARSLPRS